VMHYDIGLINDRSFHSIAGVGFDAEVVHRVTQDRTGHISHLSYAWPIWRTFWEHRFPRFRILADGEEIFDGSGMAFVGNISRYATGLRICPDARFDDGLLDLAIFPCQDRKGLITHSLRTALQRPARTGPNAAIYRQAKQIRIETDTPLPTQLDGDVGPDTPLEIRLAEHGIGVLVPASRADQLTQPQKGET
jgi:diacylglycerol kinase (ATP)